MLVTQLWHQLFVTPWTVAATLLYPWNAPGKNTEVSCHALLPSSQPRDLTQVSHIVGRFFTIWGTHEAPWAHPPIMDTALQIFFTTNLILEKRKLLTCFQETLWAQIQKTASFTCSLSIVLECQKNPNLAISEPDFL